MKKSKNQNNSRISTNKKFIATLMLTLTITNNITISNAKAMDPVEKDTHLLVSKNPPLVHHLHPPLIHLSSLSASPDESSASTVLASSPREDQLRHESDALQVNISVGAISTSLTRKTDKQFTRPISVDEQNQGQSATLTPSVDTTNPFPPISEFLTEENEIYQYELTTTEIILEMMKNPTEENVKKVQEIYNSDLYLSSACFIYKFITSLKNAGNPFAYNALQDMQSPLRRGLYINTSLQIGILTELINNVLSVKDDPSDENAKIMVLFYNRVNLVKKVMIYNQMLSLKECKNPCAIKVLESIDAPLPL